LAFLFSEGKTFFHNELMMKEVSVMDFRRNQEQWEEQSLSPYAQQSGKTKGRERVELPCSVRTEFQRDRDRIIHSKAFRRLKHKTQVFIAPEGDHYRTRLTHTLEVAQIARTIARALRLNEDLTEAIALGHDLGHTPFGHSGEAALDAIFHGGFQHNLQSLRVVEVLEKQGGLNLTWEVRDGILHHTGSCKPATLEGQIVKIADRIAYINHDIDDAVRGGIIKMTDIPEECIQVLGANHSMRINAMVRDMIEASWDQPCIGMSPVVDKAMNTLRTFLFDRVYINSVAKGEEEKAQYILKQLFLYAVNNPTEIFGPRNQWSEEVEQMACDYIAGMTDRYAIGQYQKFFMPHGWQK
jgi:dGTPase